MSTELDNQINKILGGLVSYGIFSATEAWGDKATDYKDFPERIFPSQAKAELGKLFMDIVEGQPVYGPPKGRRLVAVRPLIETITREFNL